MDKKIATREGWIELAGSTDIAFEEQALSVGREFLPACARLVVEEKTEPSADYWTWLAQQWLDAHGG